MDQTNSTAPELDTYRKKAHWLLPISRMIEYDILARFDTVPDSVTAVFIGTWSRALIEANAFRVACSNLGIHCQSVVLIEMNASVLKASLSADARHSCKDELASIHGAQRYIADRVISLDNRDFELYDADTYIRTHSNKTLGNLTIVNGDASDKKLATTITDQLGPNSSLVVIARNVEPGTYDYTDIVRVWAEEIHAHRSNRRENLIAFTTTDEQYARKMYDDMRNGLAGDSSILTPDVGIALKYPPNLMEKGANFSDTRLHLISLDMDRIKH